MRRQICRRERFTRLCLLSSQRSLTLASHVPGFYSGSAVEQGRCLLSTGGRGLREEEEGEWGRGEGFERGGGGRVGKGGGGGEWKCNQGEDGRDAREADDDYDDGDSDVVVVVV
eukprot:766413-Hanusia_phi.AAC.1